MMTEYVVNITLDVEAPSKKELGEAVVKQINEKFTFSARQAGFRYSSEFIKHPPEKS